MVVGTRAEWLAARTALLGEEKELTRRSDELARKRQELPWVPVEKDYGFEADDGTKTMPELFDGARSCSSTTSCSARRSRAGQMQAVWVARTPRTVSTAPSSIFRLGA
jgi:hypothetical protein